MAVEPTTHEPGAGGTAPAIWCFHGGGPSPTGKRRQEHRIPLTKLVTPGARGWEGTRRFHTVGKPRTQDEKRNDKKRRARPSQFLRHRRDNALITPDASTQSDVEYQTRATCTSFFPFRAQRSTDWKRKADFFHSAMFPGGGSRRRGTQGSPRSPVVPPPAGHSWPLARRRPVGSGLSARAAIGSGPGWAGRGAPAYKSAARPPRFASASPAASCVVLGVPAALGARTGARPRESWR